MEQELSVSIQGLPISKSLLLPPEVRELIYALFLSTQPITITIKRNTRELPSATNTHILAARLLMWTCSTSTAALLWTSSKVYNEAIPLLPRHASNFIFWDLPHTTFNLV